MILYYQWAELSLATRVKIAGQFGIKKTGPTEVFANTIKSDGYAIKDIEMALTIPALQKFLGTTETDHTLLWNCMVDKIEGREMKIVDTPKEEDKAFEKFADTIKKKQGRPKKITNEQNTKN